MNATTKKLNQVEAVLHSLTGSTSADELQPEQVQSMLVLCVQLIQDARASLTT